MTPYWTPERHADRRPFLLARGRIREALRRYFDGEGFLEVECGALQAASGAEAHIRAFSAEYLPEGGGAGGELYLHTSPEFACKKLLAAGETRIVDFARVYRNGERGPLHTPEFTMVEWYRAFEPYEKAMDDAVALCRTALAATGRDALNWRDAACDPSAPPERLSLGEAFRRHLGADLEGLLCDREAMARVLGRAGVDVRDGDSWSDLFSRALVVCIEPNLGQGRLTILDRYPLAEAALARACPDDPRYAERFELYACGVELANGFGELTDPVEQRRRFETQAQIRRGEHVEAPPIDEDFLAALAQMPPASGVALGFDRLVVLASGARSIDDVLWTPFPAVGG